MNTLRNRAAFWGGGRGSGEGQGRKLRHLDQRHPTGTPRIQRGPGAAAVCSPARGAGRGRAADLPARVRPRLRPAPDRLGLLPRPLPRPSPRGWWAPARYASGQVWSRRRPVVSRPSPSLGNLEAPAEKKPTDLGAVGTSDAGAMDLVITQELARAESQQGGRGRSRPPDPHPREDSGTCWIPAPGDTSGPRDPCPRETPEPAHHPPPGRPGASLNPSPWGDPGAYQDPLRTLMTPALPDPVTP